MSEDIPRRTALRWIASSLAAAWSLIVAGLAAAFVSTPLRSQREKREAHLGSLSSFNENYRLMQLKVPIQDGWYRRVDHRAMYARADENGQPQILSATCSHLGCNVNWNEESGEFDCPCHGGRFSRDGVVLSGPPPGPLAKIPTEVRDGEIYVDLT